MAKIIFMLENESGLGADMGFFNKYRADNIWAGEWQ